MTAHQRNPAPGELPAGRLRPGRRVGPWRIEAPIASGGMGDVYLATRAGEFEQRVALKVIRPEASGADLAARFRRERRLLARLEHPGIARLVDGGATDEGLLYLATEHVAGEPLDRCCAARELALRERLELFVRVCRAVQHAHRHLVVHRDLKPANILVDADGRPKLLDFGIAKLLEGEDETGPDACATTGSRPLLTPAYASPEQLACEPVTTASDVYALGVILYELLAGARPFDLTGRSPACCERTVREERPAPPSARLARTGARARGREAITEDLDTIALKALSKEPERRYASAGELAHDVELHLRGQPITARPDTLRYRAAKFVSRNRLAIGALAGVFLALAAALTASLVLLQRARGAERLERDAEGAARGLAGRLSRQIELAEAAEAGERAAGERAERLFDDLLGFSVANVSGFATRLQRLIGGTQLLADMLEASRRQLEVLAAQAPERQSIRHTLCEALLLLGNAQGNPSYVSLGRQDQALATFRRALEIAADSHARDPGDARALRKLGQAHTVLGELLRARGEPRGAFEPHLVRAHELQQELLRARPDDREAAMLLAASHDRLGVVLADAGEERIAEEHTRAGLAILLELAAREEPDEMLRCYLANGHWKLALALQDRGASEEAEENYAESLAWCEGLVAAHPDHPFYFRQQANILRWFGLFLFQQSRDDKARATLEEAGERYAELARRDPEQLSTAWEWSRCETLLGHIQVRGAEYEAPPRADAAALWRAARGHYARAVSIMEPLERKGGLHPKAAHHLETVRRALARCDEALEQHEDSPDG